MFFAFILAFISVTALPEHHHADAHERTGEKWKDGKERSRLCIAGVCKKSGSADTNDEKDETKLGTAHRKREKEL